MKASEVFSKRLFHRAWFRKTHDNYWEITLFIRGKAKPCKFVVKKIPYSSEDIVFDEEVEIE